MTSPQLAPQAPQLPGCVKTGQCELHALTASQLGALISLVLGLAIFAITTYFRNAHGQMFEQQYFVVFLATAIYYFTEEWVIEEHHVQELRALRPPFALLEFWLRVLAVILLGFIAFIPRWFEHVLNFDTTDAGLFLMACLYNLFLFWDLAVYKGGEAGEKIMPFWGDFLGFWLTILCFYNRHWLHGSNSILMIVLILVVGYQMFRSGAWASLTRMRRCQQR